MRLASSLLVLSFVVTACSTAAPRGAAPGDRDASAPIVDAEGEDAGADEPDAAGADAGGLTPTGATALEVTVGAVKRTASRAQFGTDGSGAGRKLHIEAHEGGDPACPTEGSPTPKRTIIVAGLPASAAPGASFTKADGIAVTVIDFTGDQLPDEGGIGRTSAATVTVVAIDGERSVEIAVDAELEGGSVVGRAYATYCESLSE